MAVEIQRNVGRKGSKRWQRQSIDALGYLPLHRQSVFQKPDHISNLVSPFFQLLDFALDNSAGDISVTTFCGGLYN